MRIKIISVLTALVLSLCACSVQENMNPLIFLERFAKNAGDEFQINESFDENGRYIVFFSDKSGETYVCELIYDGNQNIKKICLAGNNPSKADVFELLFENVLEVCAPNENKNEIIPNLFEKKWNYYSTQRFNYSYVMTDEGVFASIENISFATESDVLLTLKQSDIIHP